MDETLSLICGAVTGMMTGGVAGWLVSRRRHLSDHTFQRPLDPHLDFQIDHAAHQWATAQGVPEAEDLVARKIRLGIALQDRRRNNGDEHR